MTSWRKSHNSFRPFLGLFLFLLGGGVSHAETLDRVVAKVNSDIITLSMLQERVQIIKQKLLKVGSHKEFSEQEVLEEALNVIIEEKLLLQEGKKRDIKVAEEKVMKAVDEILANNDITLEQMEKMLAREGSSLKQYKNHIRDQIMASQVVQFELGSRNKVSEKRIQRYYQKHQKEYWVPSEIHVSHILFIMDKSLDEKQRKIKTRKAREVLKKLRGGESFRHLAVQFSEDVSANSGGEIGVLKRGQMVPEFEKAAFKLRAGEFSDIVETPYGLHIIMCNQITPGNTRPLNEVRNGITMLLAVKKEKKLYKKWMEDLKKAAFIEISLADNKVETRAERKELEEPDELARLVDETPPTSAKPVSLAREVEKVDPTLKTMERKLRYIRKLRSDKKISESEYQKRKKMLLDEL